MSGFMWDEKLHVGVPYHIILKGKNIMKKKPNTKNSKILYETMITLGVLKEGSGALQEIPINEIQVHLLDESGDGVILCLEYDEQTGELNKTFHTMVDDEIFHDNDDKPPLLN